MPLLVCPTCRKKFDPETTPAMPFCSERCRQIDLGRWLSEEQRLPAAPLDEDEGDDPAHQQEDEDEES